MTSDRAEPIHRAPAPLGVGTTLASRYQLVRKLGSGGMGTVFEAEHLGTRRRVALKVLRDTPTDPTAQRRLLREARAASALRHPNIVDVLDLDSDSDGTLFIVQELLVGRTLRELLRERGRLDPASAQRLLVPVAHAISFAHQHKLIHRDIKPENIILVSDARGEPQPVLIDFGLSRWIDPEAAESKLTDDGAMLGTPLYMAPEQMRGESTIDERVDQWSFGVLLYETLVGRTPFADKSIHQVIASVLTREPRRIDAVLPSLSPALATLVHAMLQKDRDRRVSSMGEVAQTLASLSLPGELGPIEDASLEPLSPTPPPAHTTARTASMSEPLPPRSEPIEEPSREPTREPSRPSPRWPIAVAIVTVAVLATTAYRLRAARWASTPPALPRAPLATSIARPAPPPVAPPPAETTRVESPHAPLSPPTAARPSRRAPSRAAHPTREPAAAEVVSTNGAPVLPL